jgi:hypothetical protein
MAKRTSGAAKKSPVAKRTYYKQSDFPLTSLRQAQKIASAIVDNFAGSAARRLTLRSPSV